MINYEMDSEEKKTRISNGVNKAVFITGCSSGIGEQTAYQFARRGWKLAVSYHSNQDQGERVVRECLRLGAADVLLVKLELVSDSSIDDAVRLVARKYGKIDTLINNAGTIRHNLLADKSFQEISEELAVNLDGPIKLTKTCLPYIKEGIINVGSTLGLTGKKTLSVYSASKFGLRGFTKALAKELPDLRIFMINPSLTATKMGNTRGIAPEKVAEIRSEEHTSELQSHVNLVCRLLLEK